MPSARLSRFRASASRKSIRLDAPSASCSTTASGPKESGTGSHGEPVVKPYPGRSAVQGMGTRQPSRPFRAPPERRKTGSGAGGPGARPRASRAPARRRGMPCRAARGAAARRRERGGVAVARGRTHDVVALEHPRRRRAYGSSAASVAAIAPRIASASHGSKSSVKLKARCSSSCRRYGARAPGRRTSPRRRGPARRGNRRRAAATAVERVNLGLIDRGAPVAREASRREGSGSSRAACL